MTIIANEERLMSSFFDRVEQAAERNQTLLCVGLDTDPSRIPQILQNDKDPVFSFNRAIIDATHDLVCCYKPQIAFYGSAGSEDSLAKSIEYAQSKGIPVLLDSKRGDIGNTAEKYTDEAFRRFGADAVTINPYMGLDSMQPFLDFEDKGIFILCRTSNPGGSDLQNLTLQDGRLLYEHVAEMAVNDWNSNGNVGLVIGATRPEELGAIREIAPGMTFLLPGVGTQGASIKSLMETGQGGGMIIRSSRAIIYASDQSDFDVKSREVAEATRQDINLHK